MESAKSRFKNIKRIGTEYSGALDLYHQLIQMNWLNFILFICCVFTFFNLLFATLYWWNPDSLTGTQKNFFDAFSFSVQTFSTIGYGVYSPANNYAHILVYIEAMFSFVLTALMTGLIFSKFARPTARIVFASKGLITTYNNKKCFLFRLGNLRGNEIVEASVKAIALINSVSPEGQTLRKQVDLNLVRNNSLFFSLTWLIIHEIDESSPLFNKTSMELLNENIEIAVSVIGFDDTFSQTIHANCIYSANDLVFDKYYADVIITEKGKVQAINYNKFHELT